MSAHVFPTLRTLKPQYVFVCCVMKNEQEAHELFIVLFTHLQFGYKKS